MTDKPTPTDAELKAMWQLHAADIGGIFCYARAVLAKWGTPAPVGVGEAAERYRNAIASACEGWTMPDGLRKHLEAALWSPPTQQPAHAQAASSAVLKAIREANMQLVRTGDDAFMLVPYKAAEAQAAEPVARLVVGKTKGGVSLTHMVVPAAYQLQEGVYALYTAPQPVAREPLPKFLALKFHARRDKKATVTLLFPGHEAADAWVRGIKGGQHGTDK